MTIVAVANELDLHEAVLRRWVQRCDEPGAAPRRRRSTAALDGGARRRRSTAASSGPSPADLAAENARLKRELDRAETEREAARLSRGRAIPRKAGLI